MLDAEIFSAAHRRPHARLVVTHGPNKGQVFAVRGSGTTIGASAECGVTLPDRAVRPLHARIVKEGSRYRLVSTEGVHGVLLNGKQVRAALLNINDRVQIGDTLLQFRMHYDPPTADERSREEMLKHRYQRRSVICIAGEVVNRIPLRREKVILGRESTCGVVLKSPFVSRRHAAVIYSADGYMLRDLSSTTGTFVNGDQVSEHPLTTGDEVQIGSFLFRFDGSSLERVSPRL